MAEVILSGCSANGPQRPYAASSRQDLASGKIKLFECPLVRSSDAGHVRPASGTETVNVSPSSTLW